MQQPEILVVAFALSGLTYYLAGLMMTMPKEEWVAWGYLMRNDSIIGMIAVGSISAIHMLLLFVQNMVSESAGGLQNPDLAYEQIMAQLILFDSALVVLYSFASGVPFLAGFTSILQHPIQVLTGSIIIWTVLHMANQFIPIIFLMLFSAGLALWSVPFRIGRSAGASLMALSMVLFVGLPLIAPIAIWLEYEILDEDALRDIAEKADSLKVDDGTNEEQNFLVTFFMDITKGIAQTIGAIIISLIIFPVMYLALLGLIAKGVSHVIGGSGKTISLGRFGLNG